MKENIRSPIVVTVGHVDHGKTTLLDKIRGTTVTKSEPGELTQHVGASYVPIETIKKICGNLLEKFKIKLEIPGLLILDTPGHAAFISLRKRGGSVSDLAILVIDIFEGFKEQTDESLKLLKKFKVPFVIAATKIDKIPGWFPNKNACFLDTFAKQREDVKEELDKRIYSIVSQLAERGFNSERFDRVENFTRQIAIAPVSGITGEGLPELLMILSGLAQNFLKDKLKLSDIGKGMVLEVKETKGLGTTLDVVLFDGRIKRGDYLVIGGKEAIVTKVRAIFEPKPLRELRIEKQFEPIEEIEASAGAKISAINLENVIAGSPFIVVKSESDIEEAKKIVQKDVEDIQFSKQIEGVIVKADTLGSLEAMVKLLTEENIPIRKAEVGNVLKQDLVELQTVKEEIYKVILIFNVKPDTEILDLAKSMNVKIFVNNVIYRLIEDYKNWCVERKEAEIREKMEKIAHPVKVKVLKGCIFHAKDPCIVGVEVIAGLLKSGVRLKRLDGKYVGKVKEIQKEGRSVDNIRMGDKVAISMEEPTAGRTFDEGDILVSDLSENELKVLREIYDRLSEDEKSLLDSL
jgi:translation initiation factor 5B